MSWKKKSRSRVPRLLAFIIAFSLFTLPLVKGEEPLRYSQDEAQIKGLLEGVKGSPGDYGIRVAESIVGKWVPLRKDAKTSAATFAENTNVTWKSLLFTNGLVEIYYELATDGKTRRFVGKYEVVHKAAEGRGNAPNVVIRSRQPTEDKVGVLVGVKIGEFNWFPPNIPVLWFCDPDGKNYFFEPAEVSGEQLFKRLGRVSSDEQERTNRRERESRELKNRRITNAQLTKQAVDSLQNGKLTEFERNKVILHLMNEGDTTCVPVLLDHLKAEHSFVVRQNAIRALGKIGDKRAVSPLLDILRASVQGKVEDEAENEAILRRNAVVALGNIGDPAALPVLKAVSESAREYQSVRDLARITAKKLEGM